MTLTFTPPDSVEAPSYSSKMKTVARKLVSGFGDGYSQRIRDGIKTQQEVWSLIFSVLNDADAETIMAFFEARGEVEQFYWTNPRGETKLFIAENADRDYVAYNNNTINVTLTEDLNG